MDRLLLKVHEAAELLGISRAKMYELLSEGSLPSIRLGGSTRIPIESLRAWIEQVADNCRDTGSASCSK